MTAVVCCDRVELTLAHRDNGRRLMANALECFADGFTEAGELLRWLSRLEYARALGAADPCAVTLALADRP